MVGCFAKPSAMPVRYPKQQVSALILAGGRGTRMQGLDKGLAAYRGTPLVQHVAAVLRGQACQVLLSANRSHPAYRDLGFEPLSDRRPDFAGPLAGIETALTVSQTPYLLVCPCDTPHIPDDYGERLWRELRHAGADAAYAWDGQRAHYLHLLLAVDRAADLTPYLDSGQRAVRHWLGTKTCVQTRFSAAELANLNSLQQLEE
jgi:molybdopterin-guanine dinucleotide biosynthesis protein A